MGVRVRIPLCALTPPGKDAWLMMMKRLLQGLLLLQGFATC